MKRVRLLFTMLLAVLLLSAVLLMMGCQPKTKETSFSAIVMRVDEKSILVRPDEAANEYKSADLISVGLSQTEIIDDEGKKILISELAVGNNVDVTYGGAIAESYPAQISDCSKLVAHIAKTQLPNPMVAFDTPDFTFVAGFKLEGIPETVKVDGVWLISGKLAQVDLIMPDGSEGTLRCAVTSEEDISGLYGISFDQQEKKQYGDVTAELFYTKNEMGLARWQLDGYDFTLWFPKIETEVFFKAAQSIISEVKAIPAL